MWNWLNTYVVVYLPGILIAIVLFVVGRYVARAVTSITERSMKRAKTDETLTNFVCKLVYIAMMVLVVVTALGYAGVPTTSFAAIIGAAGLAIGLALKDSLANFASGVMLILFRPFKVGDFVEAAGISGSVEEIQVFCTQLKTGDNKVVIVPNSGITGGNITNYSRKETRRVDMVFGIGYDDDIKKTKQILADVLAKDDRVLKDPEPVIAVSELADSSVNFVVRPWVKTPDYWSVFFDVHEAVKIEFDANGISIPYPQQDVHMHQAA